MENSSVKKSDYIEQFKKDSVIIDAHLDLLFDVAMQREVGRTKVIENFYLPEFLEGGVNIVVSSIYIDDMYLPEMALRKALNQISALHSEMDESPEKIMLCKSFDDILEAIESNKVGIMLSFEGVEPLYDDLNLLRIFYELGVRIVGLTWNRRNYAADGCGYNQDRQRKRGGLTDFGIELVEAAEDLGMIIDVSHLSDEGFQDVMEICKRPIIASHSNTRSLANTLRNLTDEQIKGIASKDGVIGINVCSLLVADDDTNANVEYIINHVDHIVNLVGINHVGIGFDFCDQLFKYSSQECLNKFPRKAFDIIKGHKNMDLFINGLIKRGYKGEEIEHILGKNFLRLFSKVF